MAWLRQGWSSWQVQFGLFANWWMRELREAAVKRALAWADQRQLGGRRWLSDGPNGGRAPLGTPSAASLSGEALRLRACANHPTERCRVAVVRLTGNVNTPLQVFEWRSLPAR